MDRQRGIRKPAGFDAALAIRTTFTPPGRLPPYSDTIGNDGLQRYKYRGNTGILVTFTSRQVTV